VLHSIFWKNLSPNGGGKPTGELASAIDRDFGSFDKFKAQLNQGCGHLHGFRLGRSRVRYASRTLLTAQFHDHESQTTQGGLPLFVLDAWEHAWYLQYLNEKVKFFDAIWNVINWKDVAERFDRVKALPDPLKKAQARRFVRVRSAARPYPAISDYALIGDCHTAR